MKAWGLLALDLDGVLIEDDSSWGRYHELLGTSKERERNMALFLSGSIDYAAWAEMDAALWKGKDASAVQRYLSELRTTQGASQLVSQAHSLGVTTMIISTGISAVAERAAGMLGIGMVESNEVEIANGTVTGGVRVRCGFQEKGLVLRRAARNLRIPLGRCACVGNDENDVPMFEAVPFSVAFNPSSEKVARKATVVVRGRDLFEVARVLGSHFESLRSCTPS